MSKIDCNVDYTKLWIYSTSTYGFGAIYMKKP